MDAVGILTAYDAEIRADPPAEVGVTRTWAGGVLRTEGAYNFIGWWRLSEDDAFAAAVREAAHFAGRDVLYECRQHWLKF